MVHMSQTHWSRDVPFSAGTPPRRFISSTFPFGKGTLAITHYGTWRYLANQQNFHEVGPYQI